ncbi:DUF1707 domain-containing protein [Nonomuraea wenchangensis]|uniref:Cell wall-active antibiotics response 4TMS YvqF n=1 Tax=Nonomuraea wenchangensis TaxID=568860 RepID=A0A1I0LII9_9ACTN|nr:DUF1707 domain-containing protein [Nonomuraea wenchangensis]SEU39683.1 Cell wall-active antibiotics response 4TMS YvqF [Nonomuraea wenchangensis]
MENSPSPRDPQLSHLRASDSNREQIASVLGEAMSTGQLSHEEYSERLDKLYQAKTMGELQLLTQDLQIDRRHPVTPNLVSNPSATESAPENVIAVFGGSERKGRWRVRRRTTGFALFGGMRFDLTNAEFEAREVEFRITAIFGGAEIIVPEGMEVRSEGIGIFGGFDVRGSEDVDPSAPVLVVKGLALFGGVGGKPRRRDKR